MPIDSKRFNNFKDAQLRSLEVISPTQIKLVVALQDSARAFDWITLELVFSSVTDARLLKENQLKFVDMQEGATLLHVDNLFAFGIGECYNVSDIKNSTLYIISEGFKYKEGQF